MRNIFWVQKVLYKKFPVQMQIIYKRNAYKNN